MDSPVFASTPAFQIWSAGVDAVRAENLVRTKLCLDSKQNALSIADKAYSLENVERLCVVGAGKAAGYLAKALEDLLAPVAGRLELFGHVNVPENCVEPTQHIQLHAARPAGVNEPRSEGVVGSKRILELVAGLAPNDLCIALITGGGSALLPLPAAGVTLEDKLQVTRIMSGSGASIQELNQVRIALSAIKGGRLAAACTANRLVTIIVSDVLGDPLDLIASGPTVHPEKGSSRSHAKEVLARYASVEEIPQDVWQYLEQTQLGLQTEFEPKSVIEHHVLANNAAAVSAAADKARELGYVVETLSPESRTTSAEEVAESIIAHISKSKANEKRCLVWGGEPIVKLVGSDKRGRGGRNQQLALKAATLWSEMPSELRNRTSILSGGTDGEDGPTDAAGALVSQSVVDQINSRGLDAQDFLVRNDAYSLFEPLQALIKTGPTHTNVCDLRIATIN